MIGRVLLDGQSLSAIPVTDILILAINSAVYFALGYGCFKLLEGVARDKGLLGHY
ncbi:hypothetical protein HYR54_16565 [Candidatus Acetothermia bacterium]|nr:hypothetical protein [Candidatus Acetothermia bacterium]MBI3459693.1 hypothetical protein [Candidatus Acetothermia bacterium]